MSKHPISGNQRSPQKLLSTAISLVIALASFTVPAQSAPLKQLQMPAAANRTKRVNPQYSYQPDLLIVMPDAKAEKDDINEVLEECHGTVVGELGQGKMRCLII